MILEDFAGVAGPPVRIVQKAGNRSVGRNSAVSHAHGDIIACTDAGCEIEAEWLSHLIAPFEDDPSTEVVGGLYRAKAESWLEVCIGTLSLSTWGVTPENFLPSTRSVAFRRRCWEAVRGFPEHLDFAEDTLFSLELRRAKFKFVLARSAIVYWRPRGGVSGLFKQYRNYGIGDAQAGTARAKYLRLSTRYGIWLVLGAASCLRPELALVFIISFVPYWLLWIIVGWRLAEYKGALVTPLLKAAMDLGSLRGFLEGWARSSGILREGSHV